MARSRRAGMGSGCPGMKPRLRNTSCARQAGPPSVELRALPEIESIRLPLLISSAVGFPNQHKASCFVKTSSGHIALERPKLQAAKKTLGDLQQFGADATPLILRKHIQLVDPILPESNHSDHHGAIEYTPHRE